MGLYLQNGYLFLVYNLGHGDTVAKSNMQLKVDKWYHVHVSRAKMQAYFIIRDETG